MDEIENFETVFVKGKANLNFLTSFHFSTTVIDIDVFNAPNYLELRPETDTCCFLDLSTPGKCTIYKTNQIKAYLLEKEVFVIQV